MTMNAIETRNLTKTYRIGVGRGRFREMLPPPVDGVAARLFPRWWSKNTFNALDDVTLSVPQGASLGILGHNGAGKTTFLKVVAQVTRATSGSVHVKGRIAALIDALVGFHPDLTGRENIHLLGGMHGFSHRDMASRIEAVLDFAGTQEMADTQIKRFSAGMAARLGFAVLTQLNVEILLIDEILAVGDSAFQRKCIDWLDSYRSAGGTLVFVSHNLALIRSMTERAAWIDHGALVREGPTVELLSQYATAMEGRETQTVTIKGGRRNRTVRTSGLSRWGAGGVRVDSFHVEESDDLASGMEALLTYEASIERPVVFCVGLLNDEGRQVASATSSPFEVVPGRAVVRCAIRPMPLQPGIYFPAVSVVDLDGTVCDHWRLERAIVMEGDPSIASEVSGPVDLASDWEPSTEMHQDTALASPASG